MKLEKHRETSSVSRPIAVAGADPIYNLSSHFLDSPALTVRPPFLEVERYVVPVSDFDAVFEVTSLTKLNTIQSLQV